MNRADRLKHVEVVEILDDELAMLSAEIHDGLLPYLYAAAGTVHSARSDDTLSKEKLATLSEWIEASRDAARRLMKGLTVDPEIVANPLDAAKSLTESTLLATARYAESSIPEIQWQGIELADRERVPAKTDWPDSNAMTVFRLVYEAVRNAIRHAEAQQIFVTAKLDLSGLGVTIEDDGKGFEIPDDPSLAGGLRWMRKRAKLHEMDFRQESRPGEGTVIHLSVPFAE